MTSAAKQLEGLSSAEEFFTYLGLEYDPRILAVSRLHILKRFHDNLSGIAALDYMDEAAQHAIYREQLSRAYADFASSPALERYVFPGLRGARGAFVALSSIQLSAKMRI